MLATDKEAANELQHLSRLEGQLKSLSADIPRAREQNETEDLLEGLKAALALEKTVEHNVQSV